MRKKNSIPGMAESCEVHFLSSPLFNKTFFSVFVVVIFVLPLLHIKKEEKKNIEMKGTALVYINYLILRYRFEFLVQFGLLNVCVYFLTFFLSSVSSFE